MIEAPFRDDQLGAERLEDRAAALAARFTIDPRARASRVSCRGSTTTPAS